MLSALNPAKPKLSVLDKLFVLEDIRKNCSISLNISTIKLENLIHFFSKILLFIENHSSAFVYPSIRAILSVPALLFLS